MRGPTIAATPRAGSRLRLGFAHDANLDGRDIGVGVGVGQRLGLEIDDDLDSLIVAAHFDRALGGGLDAARAPHGHAFAGRRRRPDPEQVGPRERVLEARRLHDAARADPLGQQRLAVAAREPPLGRVRRQTESLRQASGSFACASETSVANSLTVMVSLASTERDPIASPSRVIDGAPATMRPGPGSGRILAACRTARRVRWAKRRVASARADGGRTGARHGVDRGHRAGDRGRLRAPRAPWSSSPGATSNAARGRRRDRRRRRNRPFRRGRPARRARVHEPRRRGRGAARRAHRAREQRGRRRRAPTRRSPNVATGCLGRDPPRRSHCADVVCAGRDPAHARRGTRRDRQHLEPPGRAREPGPVRLRRGQGRHERADPRDRRRGGARTASAATRSAPATCSTIAATPISPPSAAPSSKACT